MPAAEAEAATAGEPSSVADMTMEELMGIEVAIAARRPESSVYGQVRWQF